MAEYRQRRRINGGDGNWREAGYEDEMDGAEAAIAAGEHQKVAEHLSDRWLADNTLFGPQDKVLEGLELRYDAGSARLSWYRRQPKVIS